MNPLIYVLNIMRIGLQIQDHCLAMCVDALTPGTMCISGNPPLFTPGQTFEGMVDESERGMAEAVRGGL